MILVSDTNLVTGSIPLSAHELVSETETLSSEISIVVCLSSRSGNLISSSVEDESVTE